MDKVFLELPEGATCLELPSLASRRGSRRLAVVEGVLGVSGAAVAAGTAGKYLLDDNLARGLRLKGVELPESGELSCLSPERWRSGLPDGLPESVEVLGLLLSREQRFQLQSFLQGRSVPTGARDLLELAEHFFYEDSLKLAVRYTGPRLNRP
jgi:hypothetical protein